MRYMKYVLGSALLAFLAGCGDSAPKVDPSKILERADVVKATDYFDSVLANTLKEAKQQKDPYDAYALLVKAYYGADANREPIVYKIPEKPFVIKQNKFLVKAKLDEPFVNAQYYGSYDYVGTLPKRKKL